MGTSKDLHISISDMKAGASYDIRVTARNMIGSSDPYYSDEPIIAGKRISKCCSFSNETKLTMILI